MTETTDKPLALRLKEALGDDYTIEGEIGRGGMGVVFRARDERLQRRVAVKVLPPELAYQKEIRERFTREAQTAARLSHPHIVPIHDVGEGQSLVYFIMGLVEGESLGARLKRRGKLPPEEARRIMKETADALSAAHAVSVIHRDIKPDNILLEGTRGRVMVTDFGIAKALSGATSGHTLTGAGIAIGTPQFMSPEQAAGEKNIDGRSDIYSLGVVAYQMLTGELPFSAPTVAGILMKQITEPAPIVHELRSDVPEDLSLAVARCLEKDPENRWPTADALRRSLENRNVGGYRPTLKTAAQTRARPAAGQTNRTASPRPATGSTRPRTLAEASRPARAAGGNLPGFPKRPEAPGQRPSRSPRWVRNERGEWVRASELDDLGAMRDTGEPVIVQKVRAQFAKWAAVSLGCFALNLATGINSPWFLFPAAGMGIGLMTNYAKLWQAGYSWRDVLNRPPAADAIIAPGGTKGRKLLTPPKREEFGNHYQSVIQVHTDRAAIVTLMEKLSPADKELLPEVLETADALYEKALEMARTLHSMDSNLNREGLGRIEERLGELQQEPEAEERTRRIALLEQQKKAYQDLIGRRGQVADRLESSVLAMQNMRFDLLRLRSAGVGAVINDLSQATMQARALSRDVDNAIAAASEVREALG